MLCHPITQTIYCIYINAKPAAGAAAALAAAVHAVIVIVLLVARVLSLAVQTKDKRRLRQIEENDDGRKLNKTHTAYGRARNSHVFNEESDKYLGIVDKTVDLFSLLFQKNNENEDHNNGHELALRGWPHH